ALVLLGASTQAAVWRLAPRLAAAADACPPFEARVAGLGIFPERRAPRVLWLGGGLPPGVHAVARGWERAGRVTELQGACERAAREGGLEAEERPFAPHLTLGRFRERVPRPKLDPV